MEYCVECDSKDKHKEWCSEAEQNGSNSALSAGVIQPCPFCGTVSLRFTPNGDYDGYITHLVNDCALSMRDIPFKQWQRRAL